MNIGPIEQAYRDRYIAARSRMETAARSFQQKQEEERIAVEKERARLENQMRLKTQDVKRDWRLMPGTTKGAAIPIITTICEKHNVTEAQVMSRNKSNAVAAARSEIMHAMSKTLGWTLNQIGRFFDRDHTTVLHSVRRVERRLASKYEQEQMTTFRHVGDVAGQIVNKLRK